MARLTYSDISPLLKEMYEQYTGRKAMASIDFGSMQSVFKTAISINDDNLYNIIPTVLAKTVYAVRPYSRKFASVYWDSQKYGDWVRKFTPIAGNWLANDEWNISVEEAKASSAQDWKAGTAPVKFDVLMTATNGGQAYSRKYTIYKNQLNAAFDSESGVADYFSMLMTEFSNVFEIDGENTVRSAIANIILTLADAGKETPTAGNACSKEQVFHALTAYNAETGLKLTATTIMLPENFRPFMIWFSAKYQLLMDNLSVHSTRYHANVTGKAVNRHTDASDMRVYLASSFAKYFTANGASLYNPDKVKLSDYSEVTFWTSSEKPMSVTGSAKGLKTDGSDLTITSTTVNNVIGLITDKDMFGVVPIDTWSASEPFNARFGFRNIWNHYTWRAGTDFTENAVLILLD